MELRQILSSNIKAKRKLYNLTQEKLAEETGLSTQTINDIEGCRTWVSDKTIIKLAETLHTTPSNLLASNETETSEKSQLFKALKDELNSLIDEQMEDVLSRYIK